MIFMFIKFFHHLSPYNYFFILEKSQIWMVFPEPLTKYFLFYSFNKERLPIDFGKVFNLQLFNPNPMILSVSILIPIVSLLISLTN